MTRKQLKSIIKETILQEWADNLYKYIYLFSSSIGKSIRRYDNQNVDELINSFKYKGKSVIMGPWVSYENTLCVSLFTESEKEAGVESEKGVGVELGFLMCTDDDVNARKIVAGQLKPVDTGIMDQIDYGEDEPDLPGDEWKK